MLEWFDVLKTTDPRWWSKKFGQNIDPRLSQVAVALQPLFLLRDNVASVKFNTWHLGIHHSGADCETYRLHPVFKRWDQLSTTLLDPEEDSIRSALVADEKLFILIQRWFFPHVSVAWRYFLWSYLCSGYWTSQFNPCLLSIHRWRLLTENS